VVIAGCTVGPDYAGAPQVASDALHAPAFVRAPAAAIATSPAPNRWWLALDDPQLNALIDAALAHNPDLQAAQARLRAARAQLQQKRASGRPSGSVDAAALRTREPDLSTLGSLGNSQGNGSSTGSTPGSNGRGPLQLYTAGFDASWEVDLFGGTRRAVEAASADADAVDADLADAQVSLAAEVAQTYIALRDEQERLALAHRSSGLEQQMLVLTQQRRAGGTAAEVDVERLSTQVDNTRATLTPLDAAIAGSLDQLAVLTGQAPGALDQALSVAAPLPRLPASVPIGDPASLLQRRPDIRAAERRLASSNAQVGMHIADLFPKITLLGDLGFSAADPGHLIRKDNFTWIGVPYLQWNILDFGRTRGAIHGAQAARDEAAARYTHDVLAALQDANTALSRFGYQREHLATLLRVRASAERSATLMRQRYTAGVSSLIDLLDTQRVQFTAQQNVVSGQAELLKDFVSLHKSLGLGWSAEAG
jgi:NodT family efflux transporter outer membrane factor (OMF) lipoprotein